MQNFIEQLGLLSNATMYEVIQRKDPFQLTEKEDPVLMDEDVVNITLAQYDKRTSDIIKAHSLAQYRVTKFTLVTLPEVSTLWQTVLEGSGLLFEY